MQHLPSPHFCCLQLFVNVGILTAFAIGLPYDGNDASLTLGGKHIAWWRVMFAFGTLPAIVQVHLQQLQYDVLLVALLSSNLQTSQTSDFKPSWPCVQKCTACKSTHSVSFESYAAIACMIAMHRYVHCFISFTHATAA